MITVIIEGDEPFGVRDAYNHLMVMYGVTGIPEDIQYVRVLVERVPGGYHILDSVINDRIYASGVVYNNGEPLSGRGVPETPYRYLWRVLRRVLSPRLYEIIKQDFDFANKAYAIHKRRSSGREYQDRMAGF